MAWKIGDGPDRIVNRNARFCRLNQYHDLESGNLNARFGIKNVEAGIATAMHYRHVVQKQDNDSPF
jgi:hypothetical protein